MKERMGAHQVLVAAHGLFSHIYIHSKSEYDTLIEQLVASRMVYNWDTSLRVLGSNDFAQKDPFFSTFYPFWGLQRPKNPLMKKSDADFLIQIFKSYNFVSSASSWSS